mmetsp:Transcript_84793/g.225223  ORF Transcript_84793/g.225223 Transcript_84793/m.225223 type:complete len:224 (+) Transcript_84793:463-1134(+)
MRSLPRRGRRLPSRPSPMQRRHGRSTPGMCGSARLSDPRRPPPRQARRRLAAWCSRSASGPSSRPASARWTLMCRSKSSCAALSPRRRPTAWRRRSRAASRRPCARSCPRPRSLASPLAPASEARPSGSPCRRSRSWPTSAPPSFSSACRSQVCPSLASSGTRPSPRRRPGGCRRWPLASAPTASWAAATSSSGARLSARTSRRSHCWPWGWQAARACRLTSR